MSAVNATRACCLAAKLAKSQIFLRGRVCRASCADARVNVATIPLRGFADARRWGSALLLISVMSVFSVSPMALGALGVNYNSVSGAVWQKLHPATFIAGVAFLLHVLGQPRPWAYLKPSPPDFRARRFLRRFRC